MGIPTLPGVPLGQPPVPRQPRVTPMPRPPVGAAAGLETVLPPVAGYGQRSIWPLPPVGEAQRRDPHVPDPVPGGVTPRSQAEASPPIKTVTTPEQYGARPGQGIVADGTAPALVYIKTLGQMVTSTLARNWLSGIIESRWRLGGVTYPPDFGYGPGYHGDAETVYPNNPQVYLRNPGIIPLLNAPVTWRYAPGGGIQSLGPSIADVGNLPAAATSS